MRGAERRSVPGSARGGWPGVALAAVIGVAATGGRPMRPGSRRAAPVCAPGAWPGGAGVGAEGRGRGIGVRRSAPGAPFHRG